MKPGNIFLFDLIYYGNKNKKKFLLPPLFAILSYYVMAVVCKKIRFWMHRQQETGMLRW